MQIPEAKTETNIKLHASQDINTVESQNLQVEGSKKAPKKKK